VALQRVDDDRVLVDVDHRQRGQVHAAPRVLRELLAEGD